MHLKFFILSLRNNTNSEITNFCLEKKNQPFSFLLKQSLLRFHVPNRKTFLRSTNSMKTKIYKPNWGYWRVSLSSVLSSFSPYCILQRNKALSSLPYCVSQHNKENFQRDTPITSSNCPQRGYTMLNRGWCPKGELVNGVIALSSDTSGVAQLPLPLIRKILPPRFQCDAAGVGIRVVCLSTGFPSLWLGYHPRLSMVRLRRRRWVALFCFAAEMVT